MTITLTEQSASAGTTLHVGGTVDLSTAASLTERLAGLVRCPERTVLVDLADVGFLDSTGLSALVTSHLEATDHGSTLVVLHPASHVRGLLRLTGLDQVLDVRDANA